MAGPAIRAWELARALAGRRLEVVLAAPPPLPEAPAWLRLAEANRSSVALEAARSDSVLVQGNAFELLEGIGRRPPLIVDLYDPAVIEGFEFYADLPLNERLELHARDLARLGSQLEAGDFFLCASDRQRRFWTGALTMAGRVNPLTYADDATLGRLVALVPFGLPDEPPSWTRESVLRGRVQGIGAGDLVGVWGGGIWNWFDPQTVVRAVAAAAQKVPELRVVFLGAGHPNPSVPRMRAAGEAQSLARSLGVEGRNVFFLSGWVPYEERAGYLVEADFGITLHHATVETDLAFRTRVLDYLWAGLPVITTEGDSMAEAISSARAGVAVGAGDVDGVSAALQHMADRAARARFADASRQLGVQFRWSVVSEPLAAFCEAPYRAADANRPKELNQPSLATRALRVLRREGLARFAGRAYRYLRRRA